MVIEGSEDGAAGWLLSYAASRRQGRTGMTPSESALHGRIHAVAIELTEQAGRGGWSRVEHYAAGAAHNSLSRVQYRSPAWFNNLYLYQTLCLSSRVAARPDAA